MAIAMVIRSRLLRAALAAAVLALVAPSAVEAQDRTTVRGTVVQAGTGEPVAGAVVAIASGRLQAITDAQGRFQLPGVTLGPQTAVVSRLGYRETRIAFTAEEDAVVTLELPVDPVRLERLQVNYDIMRARRNAVATSVRTLDRAQLLVSIGTAVDALRGRGVTLVACGPRATEWCALRRGRTIRPRVSIDERFAFGLDELSAYQPYDFELIEVYAGGAMIRAYTTGFMQRVAEGRVRIAPVFMDW